MPTAQERFWQQFRQLATQRGMELYPHAPGKPWNNHRHVGRWNRAGGFAFVYYVRQHSTDVSVEVAVGKGNVSGSNQVFRELEEHKPRIEAALGRKLTWDEKPDKDVAFIRYDMQDGGLADEQDWRRIQAGMIDAMKRLEEVFKPLETRS